MPPRLLPPPLPSLSRTALADAGIPTPTGFKVVWRHVIDCLVASGLRVRGSPGMKMGVPFGVAGLAATAQAGAAKLAATATKVPLWSPSRPSSCLPSPPLNTVLPETEEAGSAAVKKHTKRVKSVLNSVN